ncbi:MAG: hypothetical protein L0332_18070 [Chloroflexi bacterium]|nr:hypothetical protein [Chloroflexota bacterium]MCI0575114.1 hypothetical protein [Chloroflexota bacterium]MCI0646263.1 hypothetical protein [Chloroflexota bacterium]MCI0728608.1 hypothetical protein [Chloroflexota bacterium]
MSQSFKCPSCNAPLDYEGVGDPVIRCAYCNSAILVPEDLRARPQQPAQPMGWSAAPLKPAGFGPAFGYDASQLGGLVAQLKAIKDLIHNGQKSEAARIYQQAFGVSASEAEMVVNLIASGQGVALSSFSFGSSLPMVTSQQFPGWSVGMSAGTPGGTQEAVARAQAIMQRSIEAQQKDQRATSAAAIGLMLFIGVSILLLLGVIFGAMFFFAF